MKKLLLLTLLLTSVSISAHALMDVKPNHAKKGNQYVRVTKLWDNSIKFEKCSIGYEATTCKNIGSKTSYTMDELNSQYTQEVWEAAGSIVGGGAIAIGAFATGAYIGAGLGALVSYALLNTAGLTIGLVAAFKTVDVINPNEQWEQSYTLEQNVINDEAVYVTDISKFIKRLTIVLTKI